MPVCGAQTQEHEGRRGQRRQGAETGRHDENHEGGHLGQRRRQHDARMAALHRHGRVDRHPEQFGRPGGNGQTAPRVPRLG